MKYEIMEKASFSSLCTAFIPLCDVGGAMTGVSEKVPEMDLLVCRSFKKTIIDRQLCLELEVNKFGLRVTGFIKLVKGLTLVLEDRNLVRFGEAE